MSNQTEEILGQGAFTTMYKSMHEAIPCAIKYVDTEENSKKYIRKEAQIYKALTGCDHVVRLLDSKIRSNGYLKYELLSYDLTQIIGLLSSEEILRILAELDTALSEIHSRGVAHCDIKPENIMFCSAGKLKLIDFGNSMFLEELKTTTQRIGTLHYTPPEYIIKAPMDHRVDQWALGCVALEMLIGDTLFNPKRDNNVRIYSHLLGQMINLFGNFAPDFLDSGEYTHRYFDSEKTYKYAYLLAPKTSIYKLLRDRGYTKKEARSWEQRILPYFSDRFQ